MWDALRSRYVDYVDYEDEWSNCSRTMDCCCEDCYQNYPERFDEDGNNIWAVDDDEQGPIEPPLTHKEAT